MITHHENEKTVVLSIFNETMEARLAQDKLATAGIESFLQDENVMGLNPLGGIELKVFSNDLAKAKELLATL
ncbi:MAG: DUF2007 domain-containing protein [Bacteroidota bacterium]|nr:DUF2007 domain-containing protein [Chitinophagaceae bacterium]MDZ4808605.1 DUF2007 domain-containing protein [Bacteroidota bacterium]